MKHVDPFPIRPAARNTRSTPGQSKYPRLVARLIAHGADRDFLSPWGDRPPRAWRAAGSIPAVPTNPFAGVTCTSLKVPAPKAAIPAALATDAIFLSGNRLG